MRVLRVILIAAVTAMALPAMAAQAPHAYCSNPDGSFQLVMNYMPQYGGLHTTYFIDGKSYDESLFIARDSNVQTLSQYKKDGNIFYEYVAVRDILTVSKTADILRKGVWVDQTTEFLHCHAVL